MRPLVVVFWTLLTLLGVGGGLVGAWLSTPSSAYITVTGYSVERQPDGEWRATSGRELHRGSVRADWSVLFTVMAPDHGYVCYREGQDVYDDGRLSPVTYSVSPWADDCLDAEHPVFVSVSRGVRLWGWLPLRPAVFAFQVLPPIPAAATGIP